jgi:hypothetical protein
MKHGFVVMIPNLLIVTLEISFLTMTAKSMPGVQQSQSGNCYFILL